MDKNVKFRAYLKMLIVVLQLRKTQTHKLSMTAKLKLYSKISLKLVKSSRLIFEASYLSDTEYVFDLLECVSLTYLKR